MLIHSTMAPPDNNMDVQTEDFFPGLFQLTDFGEIVTLNDGKMCFSPPGPKNIYLPYIHILDQTSV